jgi:MFS family permease
MSSWISSFMESSLGIPKELCDIGGLAVFAILLGSGRILYTKYGKNISNVLLAGMISAAICYIVIGVSSNVILSFVACILTGFCVSMLWPGTLIFMEENIKGVGVAAFALMAAGGDFGSSVGPQLLGVVVDTVGASDFAMELGQTLSLSPEQIGMKTGMLVTAIFPIIGIAVVLVMKKYFFSKNKKISSQD